jgi:hypothetical protein
VLGVGSIPSVELGSGYFISQSTDVPLNGAYILSEDQTGASTRFGSSNAWDWSGGKSTLATYSTNFADNTANFSLAEQGSLVSQRLSGVCSLAGGCPTPSVARTSVGAYKIYPMAGADIFTGETVVSPGVFFTSDQAGKVVLTCPSVALQYRYWGRSTHYFNDVKIRVNTPYSCGRENQEGFSDDTMGTRPAGVLNLESVLLYRVGQI